MLHDETVVSFSEAAAALPRRNGKKIHTSTLWRWARRGIKGVRLETRRVGGRFVTSLQALERFSRKLAEIEVNEESPSPLARSRRRRSPRQRERAITEAERELAQAGV